MSNHTPPEVITKAEFARRVGISKQRVTQLTQAGRLPVTADNRIPWPEARDVLLARRAEDDNPSAQLARAGRGDANDAAIRSSLNYAEARAAKEALRAQLLNLQVKRVRGELVPVAEVEADAQVMGEELRAALLALPSRICPLCQAKPLAEAERIWEDALNEVLAALHGGRFLE